MKRYLLAAEGENSGVYFIVVFLLHLEVFQVAVKLVSLPLLLCQFELNFLDELHIFFSALSALEPLIHYFLVLLKLVNHVVFKGLNLFQLGL